MFLPESALFDVVLWEWDFFGKGFHTVGDVGSVVVKWGLVEY